MTSDIQAILHLLQRQTTCGPPAYSTVTSSPDYQRAALRGQSEATPLTDLSLAPVQPHPQVRLSLLALSLFCSINIIATSFNILFSHFELIKKLKMFLHILMF